MHPKTSINQFICPVTNHKVVKPCGLTKCRYHVKSKASRNCLLIYPVDALTLAEVSFLYQRPFQKLKIIYKRAMNKIYDHYIEEALIDIKNIYYPPSLTNSIRTHKPVKDPIKILDNYVIDKTELGNYPLKIWEKAIYHGAYPKDIMKATLKLFKNNRLLDDFLNLPKGSAKNLRSIFV